MAHQKTTKRRPAAEQDQLIAEALRKAGGPVSAYDLIDNLRAEVLLAPQTVYRSLDRLIAAGAAHRLESLNAFVACAHAGHKGVALFAICDRCRTVIEFDEARAVEALGAWAKKARFSVRTMTLELKGTCANCTSASPVA